MEEILPDVALISKFEFELLWVDNGNYLEPHLALFIKLQEAYPEYKNQFYYV